MRTGMIRWSWLGMLLAVCACGNSRKDVMQSARDNGLLQEKSSNGFLFRLQYMPPAGNADTGLLTFRLNVTNSDGSPMRTGDDNRFSFGLDSLFAVVNVTDTLRPVDAFRVANGNIGGLEYMLLFERPAVYSQVNCQLLFRDWLFSRQFITFPLNGNAIAHIDSLSLKI